MSFLFIFNSSRGCWIGSWPTSRRWADRAIRCLNISPAHSWVRALWFAAYPQSFAELTQLLLNDRYYMAAGRCACLFSDGIPRELPLKARLFWAADVCRQLLGNYKMDKAIMFLNNNPPEHHLHWNWPINITATLAMIKWNIYSLRILK